MLCVHITYSRTQGNKDESTALSSAFDDLRIFGLVIFPLSGSRAHIRALLLRGSPPPIPEFGRVRFQSAVRGSSYRGCVNTHTRTHVYIYIYIVLCTIYAAHAQTHSRNAIAAAKARIAARVGRHQNTTIIIIIIIFDDICTCIYSRCKRARR